MITRTLPGADTTSRRNTASTRRLTLLSGAAVLLVVVAACSLFVGSHPAPAADVVAVLLHPDSSEVSRIVHQQRLPRMLLVIAVGAGLGVAGALMQALTRNPLAEPGILGVNAGASLAVVAAVAVFGRTDISFYLWFGLAGAAVASVLVAILGGVGARASSAARLALAGVAVSMAISSLVQVVLLTDQVAFNEFRFWAAGSFENRGYPVIEVAGPVILLGLLIALGLGPSLNAMALSDEVGKGLGVNLPRTRVLSTLAVTLTAGAATAAVGPISFIGLGVPHLARALFGADQRWVIPFSALAAPVLLLLADLLARVAVAPQEIQTGIITALIGGPVFIYLLRRSQGRSL